MPDLTKMSVPELGLALTDARRSSLSAHYGTSPESAAVLAKHYEGIYEAILAELTRRIEVPKGGCSFCMDCDAKRNDPTIQRLLFKISEQGGKRNWWNVLTYLIELHSTVVKHMHADINALAAQAKGVEG